MKKLSNLLYIISCCFVLCMFQTAYASDVDYENSLLYNLGVSEFEYEFEDTDTITRGKFMVSLAELMTGEKLNNEDAFKVIKDAKLTDAQDLQKFNSGRSILTDEAVKMIVCLLGRGDIALVNGSYPNNYYNVAYDMNLIRRNSIVQGKELTKGQFRKILVDLIDMEMTKITNYSSDAFEYASTGETFLEHYRDITKVTGIVERNEYTSLYSAAGGTEGYLTVNGVYYSVNSGMFNSLIGCNSILYVNEDTDVLVYAYPYKSEFIDKIDEENIIGMSGNYRTFEYTDENEKIYNYKISPTVKVLYNNVFYKDYTQADFKPVSGYVRLIDNDYDEVIDVVDIHDYKVSIVNYVSVSDQKITNNYGNTDSVLDFSNYNSLIISKNDEEIGLSDIEEGNILRVALSKDSTIAEIVVSELIITGNVSSKNDERVVIGEKYYEFANEFKALLAMNKPGYVDVALREQVFYLDCFGKIVAVKNGSTMDEIYVYAFKMYHDDDGFVCIKYMDTNSNLNAATLKDRVRLNDDGATSSENVYNYFGAETFTKQLLKIRFNNAGLITAIQEPEAYVAGGNKPFTVHSVSQAKYRKRTSQAYSTHVFTDQGIQQGFVDDKTVVFFVGTDYDSSYLGSVSDFTDGRTYNLEFYNLDEYKFSKLAVCKINDSNVNSVGAYLVTKEDTILNADDEIVGVFSVSVDQIMDIEVPLKNISDLDKADPGDLVKFKVDALGNIEYQETLYSPKSGKIFNPITNEGGMNISGHIREISFGDGKDSRVRIDCNGNEYVCPVLTNLSVDIFGMKTKKSYHGTLKDIAVGDYFYGYSDAFRLLSIIVYKNIQ